MNVYDFLNADDTMTFNRRISKGQRVGQAFMNVLSSDDYDRLTGTPADPFHSEDWADVEAAIDFLTQ